MRRCATIGCWLWVTARQQACELTLGLAGVGERDHHGRPSLRVGGRIFATRWNAVRMSVMVDEGGIRTYAASDAGVFSEVWWGRQLCVVRVRVQVVSEGDRATC